MFPTPSLCDSHLDCQDERNRPIKTIWMPQVSGGRPASVGFQRHHPPSGGRGCPWATQCHTRCGRPRHHQGRGAPRVVSPRAPVRPSSSPRASASSGRGLRRPMTSVHRRSREGTQVSWAWRDVASVSQPAVHFLSHRSFASITDRGPSPLSQAFAAGSARSQASQNADGPVLAQVCITLARAAQPVAEQHDGCGGGGGRKIDATRNLASARRIDDGEIERLGFPVARDGQRVVAPILRHEGGDRSGEHARQDETKLATHFGPSVTRRRFITACPGLDRGITRMTCVPAVSVSVPSSVSVR